MMGSSDETSDLLATVEEIRKREFPNVDQDLVNEILRVQHKFAGDRAEARKQTEQMINQWASTHAVSKDPA